ncbi:DUF935 domain-containing protein, partial [Methylogaea oryzae]|uniref:DUF935 domain-containing protein n=1 Tax=Methylogaea oryzae TaxID=1295382 RepID=UPI0020D114D0
MLQSRGGGDYKLYEDLLRDDQVKTCLAQRKLALVSKEWKVEPATSGRRDKKAADALKAVLDRLAWDEMSQKMLAGIFYGHSVAEILWGTDGAETTIEAIKVRKQRRFGFSPQGELKLITSANAMGEVMPDRKFWTFATGADDDDEPYGLGLAHWLYWPVFFKRNGIKFWLTFLEKFAAPTVVGKYPSTATPGEKDALLQAAAAVQRDAAIRIPESMQIELIEAARSGTVDYVALCDRMDNAIAKVILGHTASTQSTPGKWGAEHLAQDVREDIIKADADLICGSFNLQVARWFTEYNDPQANPPRVWRDCEAQEDLKARADRDKVIFDMGFKPTAKYITDTYSGEWEEKTAPPPNVGAQPNGAPAEGQPAPASPQHHLPPLLR